ncbi:hypothetical protein K474DRAFT_1685200 [Panus rudis PR-1116 ss-1]|nr:hypothetical protein K474DRAFT_1685200 [Panus rudis PR-1116 ss-1]
MKRAADVSFDLNDSQSTITLPESPGEGPSHVSSPSTSQLEGPPRKRSRSELTAEERKEARAHRNRIAAQNSRDRRKAQFAFLERRVAELEEENRQLKAGMGLTALAQSSQQSDEQREKEKAREKENEELRERIKTLENGWDAVVKALAASGLPLNIPTPPTSQSAPSSSSSQPPSMTFPVMIDPSPVAPMTPITNTPSSSSETDFDEFEPTRHLARVATTDAPPLSSLTSPSSASIPTNLSEAITPADEELMQNIFSEILAASPNIPSAPLPTPHTAEINSIAQVSASAVAAPSVIPPTVEAAGSSWDSEAEMQRLLDMLPDVQVPNGNASIDVGLDNVVDFPSALDLEIGGWDMGHQLSNAPMVGAF